MVKYILVPLSLMALGSCLIENDMSYPRVSADILSFAVEGQRSVTIDAQRRTVSVVLSETADITSLEVTDVSFSDMTRCTPELAVGSVLDLSGPYKVTLSIYQDYEWTITATQPVERYIRCTNQIGDAEFDVEKKNAIIRIAVADEKDPQALRNVTFNSMKLEPEGAEFVGYIDNRTEEVLPVSFPLTLDCTLNRYFVVKYKDEEIRWTVNALPREVDMTVTSVNPWCYSADIEGLFNGNGSPYLEYRTASSGTWIRASDEVNISGTALSVKLTGLSEGTEYHIRFSTGDNTGDEYTFTTGTPDQIENMDFDDWYYTGTGTRPIWYPNLNETVTTWGTANPGSGTFIGSLTTRTENVCDAGRGEGKYAARLESKNAIITFAAGNIFTGQFGHIVELSGAELYWGVPFTARPKSLKGYYSYEPVAVNYVKPPYENLKNTMDQCQILVMLTDWSGPFTINTTDGIFVDQTRNNSSIIAYGKLESDENTGGQYKEFTIDLEYWRPDATPSYAVVVACSSYKGDYFTGGIGSVMYVDEFEFVYE